MNRRRCAIIILLLSLLNWAVFSQDNENSLSSSETDFDDFDSDNDLDEKKISVGFNGSLNLGGTMFFDDFKKFADIRPSSLIWGDLHLTATAPIVEAVLGVSISDTALPFNFKKKPQTYPRKPQIPRFIDETYMQLMFDSVVFGGGLKRMTWGRADYFSVLDVINPKDLTDPTITDPKKLKIPRPMIFISAYLPKEVKLEFVYLPVFQGNLEALSGRWKPSHFQTEAQNVLNEIQSDSSLSSIAPYLKNDSPLLEHFVGLNLTDMMSTEIDSAKLKYSQAGMRVTSTIEGFHDLGFQYYYGRLPSPAFKMDTKALFAAFDNLPNILKNASTIQTLLTAIDNAISSNDTATAQAKMKELAELIKKQNGQKEAVKNNFIKAFALDYNDFHQIGIDYATGLGPVNLRTELAANITRDIYGNNPGIYNPSLAWHVGLDYKTKFGMTLNLAVSENIKLLYSKIGTKKYDTEKGSLPTDTKVMFLISQSLLRGSMALNLKTIMSCESVDFYINPSMNWLLGSVEINTGMGFFLGRNNEYKDNHFVHLSISYNF
ncbi:MAG: hypothetical protein CR988_01465 [Treponema sp.]|nr:MAG: hypothetical protein CR988_01465 [Treponema sp.]